MFTLCVYLFTKDEYEDEEDEEDYDEDEVDASGQPVKKKKKKRKRMTGRKVKGQLSDKAQDFQVSKQNDHLPRLMGISCSCTFLRVFLRIFFFPFF